MDDIMLSGTFALHSAPEALFKLTAANAKFSGTAVIARAVSSFVDLRGNDIETVVDESGVTYSEDDIGEMIPY